MDFDKEQDRIRSILEALDNSEGGGSGVSELLGDVNLEDQIIEPDEVSDYSDNEDLDHASEDSESDFEEIANAPVYYSRDKSTLWNCNPVQTRLSTGKYCS